MRLKSSVFDRRKLHARTVPGTAKMKTAGTRMAATIRSRTRAGKDDKGRRFAPYSGKRKGERVDLTDTGEMLNKLGPKRVTSTSVSVGWTSRKLQDRAAYNENKHPKRPFMGLSKSEFKQATRGLLGKK